MRKVRVTCDTCGAAFRKPKGAVTKRNFCCKAHFQEWNSKRVSEYNRTENLANTKEFWTAERKTQNRFRNLGKGENRAYKKLYGRHAHRVVAEETLGRPLAKGEIVHHVNGDKCDNRPENLTVMTQGEHSKLHFALARERKKSALEARQRFTLR